MRRRYKKQMIGLEDIADALIALSKGGNDDDDKGGNEGGLNSIRVVVTDDPLSPHPSQTQVVVADEDYEAIGLRRASLMNENRLREHMQTIARLVHQLQVMRDEMRRQAVEMSRVSQRWRDGRW